MSFEHTDRLSATSGELGIVLTPNAPTEYLQQRPMQHALDAALREQLDRVLAELWTFADSAPAVMLDNVAIAQIAMRLCDLYPRAAPAGLQFTLGSRVLELCGRDVHIEDEVFRLTRREAALLHHLLIHRGRVVTRPELMEQVWGSRFNPAAARTVDIHVYRLRSKLGSVFAEHLETVRHVGYRLSATSRSRLDAV